LAPSQRLDRVVDPSKTGPPTVVGRVLFRGAILPPTQIKVDRDVDICGAFIHQQPVSIDPITGGLRNAIVHVDVGAEAFPEGLRDVIQVRNKKCAFYPRVAPGRTGGEVEIVNDDALMHNTNITSGNRTVLNVALVARGNPVRKQFKKPGLHLVKCNVHKFMYGYRYLFDDPFFAMTTEAGQFRISHLPPGNHTVTVWHETLGTLQKNVQVPAQGTVNLDLEFK
jgi:plastocyanin